VLDGKPFILTGNCLGVFCSLCTAAGSICIVGYFNVDGI
jgi:hypothetical protein